MATVVRVGLAIKHTKRLFPNISRWSRNNWSRRALSTTITSFQERGPTAETEATQSPARRKEPAEADNLMDIGIRNIFNEDHDLLRQNVRRFVAEEIKPRHREWELRGYPDREVFKQMCDVGLSCMNNSIEDYGQGGTVLDASVVLDEFFYANANVYQGIALLYDVMVPYIARYGSKDQKEKYLKGVSKEGLIGALGMTEPGAGSDLQGIATTAIPDGDDWIINGSKMFISNGYICDFCLVVAKTSQDAKSAAHGLSIFLVDADTPGFTKGKPMRKLGSAASDTAPLYFDDVRVPKSAVLGEINHGFGYMMSNLPIERLALASAITALAEFMFEETRSYVKQRKAFGRHLSNLQVIQHKLAEMKTYICTSRAFTDQCLATAMEGRLDLYTSSMAKYWCTDMALSVGNDCVQLHGGTGYMEESEIARAYAWARVGPIYAGTNEIMKELISRKIVKGP